METLSFTHSNPKVQRMIDLELAHLARAQSNIMDAVADGRISEHDGDERSARAEQKSLNTIAHFSGQPRPAQRIDQPLDDPDADSRY